MLPVVILEGLGLGALAVTGYRHRYLVALGVGLALVWGLIVGVIDDSVATFAAGTALAVANLAVGAAVALGVAWLVRAGRRTPHPG